MEKRKQTDPVKAPLAIYEVHLGSWRKTIRPERDNCYTYREAAKALADYVKHMGYTMWSLWGSQSTPLTAPGAIR